MACLHATVYENPTWEDLVCFTCGEEVEVTDE